MQPSRMGSTKSAIPISHALLRLPEKIKRESLTTQQTGHNQNARDLIRVQVVHTFQYHIYSPLPLFLKVFFFLKRYRYNFSFKIHNFFLLGLTI